MEESLKIAVCLVGQVRTSHATHGGIKEYLGSHLNNCDFYIHTWTKNTLSPGVETAVLDRETIVKFHSWPVPLKHIQILSEEYNPKELLVEEFVYDPKILCPGFYQSLNRVIDHVRNDYDLIVVMRPDLVFDSSKKLSTDLEFLEKYDFLYTDMFEDGDTKIDSALWIFPASNLKVIKEFCEHLINDNPVVDDQVYLKSWLEGKGIKIKAVHNKNIWIYRLYHAQQRMATGWHELKYHDRIIMK